MRGGMGCGAGFQFVFYGKGVGVGRADLQPVNRAIPAGRNRFKLDEPEHGVNPARSVFVQLKHAQTSLRPCGGNSGAHSALFAFSGFRI